MLRRYAGIVMFPRAVFSTHWGKGKVARHVIRPPKGAMFTESHMVPLIQENLQRLQELDPSAQFRVVRIGVGSYNFIHPSADRQV